MGANGHERNRVDRGALLGGVQIYGDGWRGRQMVVHMESTAHPEDTMRNMGSYRVRTGIMEALINVVFSYGKNS